MKSTYFIQLDEKLIYLLLGQKRETCFNELNSNPIQFQYPDIIRVNSNGKCQDLAHILNTEASKRMPSPS